ncbi:MAG: CPBP family intramembrane metalloprotease [Oscillospiraceae bacterium]|nr:CPBP family intramembrane metalloprotease [Oscillospiraceae bacterium]
MKKLFEKNEVTFAVILIVVYVVGSSIMMNLSESLGSEFLAQMIFHIVMSVMIFVFIKKNDLMNYLGLCSPEVPAGKMLFYIPLLLPAVMPIFFGIGLRYSPMEMVFRTVSMICVGFLEEIIFRGFLFKGICKSNVTRAIVISSVTFGIGHIVNLLNGYDIVKEVIQIIYAVCVGFLLVFIFYRTGSLIMCIVFHSLNNSLTAFATTDWGESSSLNMILLAVRLIIMVAYTVYIVKFIPKRAE